MTEMLSRANAILLSPVEAAALETLRIPYGSSVRLVDAVGESISLPAGVEKVLLDLLRMLPHSEHVTVGSLPEELSSSVAADLIGVSRPTLMKWADEGRLPSHKVGSHNRFLREDVLEFRDQYRAERAQSYEESRDKLDELVGPAVDEL